MRLTVIGSTGRIGRHVVTQAVEAGHYVKALTRSPERISEGPSGLRVVVGRLEDGDALREAIDGADAVISTIGPDANDPAQVEILRGGMERTIAAMRAANVGRIINLSGAGISAPGERKPLLDRMASMIVRRVARYVVAAKQAEYDVLAASDLEWVAVRPALVTDGPLTGKYIAGPDALRPGARISRADVAHLMLAEAAQPSHIGHPGMFIRQEGAPPAGS